MGPRSPSEFLEFLTATGGNIFPRNSILKIWYERLPPHISILIDSEINSQNETSVVQKADKIFLKFSRDKKLINAISPLPEQDSKEHHIDRIEQLFEDNFKKLCNSISYNNNNRSRYDNFYNRDKNRGRSREKNSKNHKSNSRDRFSSRDRYYRSPRRFEGSSRARSASRERSSSRERFSSRDRSTTPEGSFPKNGLCFYHYTYRSQAHKCSKPCNWHDRKSPGSSSRRSAIDQRSKTPPPKNTFRRS